MGLKFVTDPPFALSAATSSGLVISFYSSSNTSVVTVVGNTVTTRGEGETTITARQTGNANYNAAVSQGSMFLVLRAGKTIPIVSLPVKVYGDLPFNLPQFASSGLPISYSSSDAAVASVNGRTVTIQSPGSTTITASQAGNQTYAPVTRE